MASIKTILVKHKQKKNGTYPIAIRIIKNRKPSYIFTGEYILLDDWDETIGLAKSSHKNSTRLNNFILKKFREAHATVLEVEGSEAENHLSTKQIKRKINRKGNKTTFFELASTRITNKYMSGTFSVAKSELSILYNINEFINLNKTQSIETVIVEIKERRKQRMKEARKSNHNFMEDVKLASKLTGLHFEDIDIAFINRFKTFCSSHLGQKSRTITNQLIFVRTLYNLAIKENIVDKKHYPFAGENEKLRIKSGNKIGLTKDEISRIENLETELNSSKWHTKNVWLFAYYFAGIRVSDVVKLKWSDFADGRLYYQMNKNEKPVSLKIPNQAELILKLYRQDQKSKTDYIFPFLKKANQKSKEDIFIKTRNATKLFNKFLKRIAVQCNIDKNLSNHIARHSFGNIAGDRINPLMLQKLYRHTDLKTTIGYQANFIHREVDDALDTVLNT